MKLIIIRNATKIQDLNKEGHSMKSKQRHSGGSYRRMKTMKAMHLKAGKDRKKANRQNKSVCNNNPYRGVK
jgi:hypothetical protein